MVLCFEQLKKLTLTINQRNIFRQFFPSASTAHVSFQFSFSYTKAALNPATWSMWPSALAIHTNKSLMWLSQLNKALYINALL